MPRNRQIYGITDARRCRYDDFDLFGVAANSPVQNYKFQSKDVFWVSPRSGLLSIIMRLEHMPNALFISPVLVCYLHADPALQRRTVEWKIDDSTSNLERDDYVVTSILLCDWTTR